jgi:hypothetical protein
MAHCGIGLYPVLSDVKRSGVWLEWGGSGLSGFGWKLEKPDSQTAKQSQAQNRVCLTFSP